MSEDKDFNNLLEKIYLKLENFNSFDEADLFEIKNQIREINGFVSSAKATENFEKLNSKLEEIENCNTSLKSVVTELIDTTSSTMAKLSTTDESSIIKLQTFLTELSYQVSSIKDDIEKGKTTAQNYLVDGFEKFASATRELEERLSANIKTDFESVNNALSQTIEELNSKLTELQLHFEKYNNTLIKEIVENINDLQTGSENINNHLENIANLQNLNLTLAEFEEYNEQTSQELNNIFENTKKIDTIEFNQVENVTKLKAKIEELHSSLIDEIEKILNNPAIKEEFQVVKAALLKNNETLHNQTIEQINEIIKDLKNHTRTISDMNIIGAINKVDVIYDNIKIINDWMAQFDKINESIKDINSKIDGLDTPSIDYEDLTNKIDIVYDNISILNEWTNKLDTIDEQISAITSKIEESNEFSEQEQEQFDKIDIIYENISALNAWVSKIDSISSQVNSIDGKISQITAGNNKSLQDLSIKIAEINTSLSSLSKKVDESFEFTEEEEEQHDKIDIIYENMSLLNNWITKIDDISDRTSKIEDIKTRLEALSNEFAVITTATKDDTDEYIYTLLDIESDFAKLRCALDDSTKITSEDLQAIKEQFDVLNEDISSISKRTNKLILTSDDANKVFKGHVDEFHSLISQLSEKILAFNPIKQYTLLDNKINTVKKLAAGNATASQNLNEAFIYLAEWIDSTGSAISEIQDNVVNIQSQVSEVQDNSTKIDAVEIKNQIAELSDKINEISDVKTEQIKSLFSELQNGFNNQQERISELENKVDTLITTIEETAQAKTQEENSEIKTVLDFIASQVISANENSINNKVLNQKMEVMEHQLSKFEKNIAKLVSYLDED